MRARCVLPLAFFAVRFAAAQQSVSINTGDGGTIYADVYGKGTRGVVLAHGGRFRKESWRPQAGILVSRGFQVLAFDFRGTGRSTGPLGRLRWRAIRERRARGCPLFEGARG